jgi:hypothetical protein
MRRLPGKRAHFKLHTGIVRAATEPEVPNGGRLGMLRLVAVSLPGLSLAEGACIRVACELYIVHGGASSS